MAHKKWRLVVKREIAGGIDRMHVFNGEWQDRAGARRDASVVKPMLGENDSMFLQTVENVYCVDDAE